MAKYGLNHYLTNVADAIAELWEFGTAIYHSQYPSSATGASLDNAAQYGGSTRGEATKSYYRILCTGVDGTLIPAGTTIASDTSPETSLRNPVDGMITEHCTPSPLTPKRAPAKRWSC